MLSVFHDVFELGVNSNASDWHIKDGAPIALRIANDLVDTDFVAEPELVQKFIGQIAEEKLLLTYEEVGDMDLSYVEDDIGRFRVNVHRQRGMNAVTMRHVKTDIMSINDLGVPPIVKKLAESQRGIIMVCGTTGSGKSTTLAAMISHVNQLARRHVITIEDPIEYDFFDDKCFIEQREIGLDVISFASALVHALRQDPDILMVGEMRDRQSFEAAMQAADTGHLVLSTLHATNASQAINRILDFFKHEEQNAIRSALAQSLRATIAQRLLPKAFGGGMTPTVEIMINTPIVRKLLEQNRLEKLAAAIENGVDDGMQSFNKSLLGLVNEGLITEEEGLEAATNPDALRMNLQGIFLSSEQQILGS